MFSSSGEEGMQKRKENRPVCPTAEGVSRGIGGGRTAEWKFQKPSNTVQSVQWVSSAGEPLKIKAAECHMIQNLPMEMSRNIISASSAMAASVAYWAVTNSNYYPRVGQ